MKTTFCSMFAAMISTMVLSSGCEEKTAATDPIVQSTPGSTKRCQGRPQEVVRGRGRPPARAVARAAAQPLNIYNAVGVEGCAVFLSTIDRQCRGTQRARIRFIRGKNF